MLVVWKKDCGEALKLLSGVFKRKLFRNRLAQVAGIKLSFYLPSE